MIKHQRYENKRFWKKKEKNFENVIKIIKFEKKMNKAVNLTRSWKMKENNYYLKVKDWNRSCKHNAVKKIIVK